MRKFTLIFTLLVAMVTTAMAQVQSSTNTDAPEYLYKIKTKRNIYMAAHGNPTLVNYGRFAFFAVEGKENAYKIYSYDADLWLSYTLASGYNNGMNFVSFAKTKEEANEWNFATVGEYYRIAPYNTTAVAGKYWNFFGGIENSYYSYDDYRYNVGLYDGSSDDGSAWSLEAVADDDKVAPTTLNYELTDNYGNVYSGTYTGVAGRTRLFTCGNTQCPITDITFDGNTYKANINIPFPISGVVISTFHNDNIIRLSVKEGKEIATKTSPTTETINNYLWDICPSFADNALTFSIKHVETGKFLYTIATARAHDDTTVTLADEGTQFAYVANNGFKYGNLWLSTNSRNNDEQCLGLWDTQHDGAKHLFHRENNFTITDEAGNVYNGNFNGYGLKNETFLPAFTGVDAGAHGAALSEETWNNEYNFSATIDFNYPVSKVGETPNEILLDLYKNQTKTTTKYLRAEGDKVKVQTEDVVKVDMNALWAIYPSYEDSKFNFTIMNIATGKYIYSDAANNSSKLGDDSDVVLNTTGSKFIIAGDGNDFRFADRENLFLSINSDRDKDVLLGVHSSAHGGTQMTASEVESYGVKVGETKYATFYAPVAVTVPEGVTAYSVTVNGEWATLNEIGTTIPANTGVVLCAENADTYTFNVTTTDETVESALTGTVAATYVTDNACVLANGENGVGFYGAIFNQNNSTAFLNNGHKAYLPISAPAEAVGYSFRFADGNTTAVEKVEVENEVKEIYDLQGRRIDEITKPGIYVVNGNKVLVK